VRELATFVMLSVAAVVLFTILGIYLGDPLPPAGDFWQ